MPRLELHHPPKNNIRGLAISQTNLLSYFCTSSKGLLAALLLGLVFGVALGPCTFAYMAPMLAVSFKVASSRPVFSVLLLALYGVGHCAVIVAAGTFTEVVQRYLNWNERSRGEAILRGLCGVLVLAGGVYLIHVAR